jgi:hypothetical protein
MLPGRAGLQCGPQLVVMLLEAIAHGFLLGTPFVPVPV